MVAQLRKASLPLRAGMNMPSLKLGEGVEIKSVKVAFTLAEVLITLGIIGVVAAMTIPGLMTTHKAHRMHAQFLKSYSTVQQVFKQMEADDVSTDPSTYDRTKTEGIFYNTFKRYLTGITDCGVFSSKSLPCYKLNDTTKGYKSLNGSTFIAKTYFDDGQVALQDGTLLIFEQPNLGNIKDSYIWVLVDINGFKEKPNRMGYDLFVFHFQDGELRTMGAKGTMYEDLEQYCSLKSNQDLNGIACAQRAKSEADYFKWVIKNVK
uniref:Prepilin-type N-terminal cleavage/methylation domain-containing protein n=1 Tax=uncultured Candidatus Melainabacteria bacterium TaxID=2682970 RepID=A0A650EJE4_9BACT|nr:hypothetical protein Melaina855_2060 [uncultured Candidatus Melainabacteria bacterium]